MMILGKFRQWLHDNFEARPQGQSVSQERRVQLRLEALEAREVPATFNVSTIDQLRAAIDKANSTAAADVINLKAGVVFDLNTTDAPKSPNLGNPLVIASGGGALTIRVASGANATLLQDGTDRIFIIEAGAKLTLSKVTITGGYADADSDFGAQGGGILSFGTLSIANSTITNNYVFGDGCEGGSNAIGGGIASYGALTITNSTIAYNTAEAGDNWYDDCIGYFAKGGGVAHFKGKLTITNTLFRDNLAQGGFSGAEGDAIGGFAAGGGLFAGPNDQAGDIPSISITSSTFLRNQAIGGGAEGYYDYYANARGGDAFGGGAALGGPYGSKYPPDQSTAAITITGTTFTQNLAQGGDAEFTGGEGSEAIGGNASGGGLFFSVQANVVLSKDNFIQNQAQGGQGEVDDDSFEGGNYARGGSAFGGGVAAGTRFELPVDCCGYQTERLPFYGNLTITSGDFRSNKAQGGDAFGGAEGSTNGGDAYGGGLAQYGGRGLTQVTSSTFSVNEAKGGEGDRDAEFNFGYVAGGNASGGGIFFDDGEGRRREDEPLVSRLNIKNSTLQSNQAKGGDAILDGAEGNGGYAYAGEASGGGLAVRGRVGVTISGTNFNSNQARGGKADVSGGEGGEGGDAYGGAVSAGQGGRFSGTLSITSSTFTANKATGGEATVNDPDGPDDFDGLWAYGGNGVGGALALGGNDHHSSSTNFGVTLSTFTANEANGGKAVIGGQGEAYGGDGIGGAIAHGGGRSSGLQSVQVNGGSYFDSVLNVTTTTFARNTAHGGDAETRGSSSSCDDRAQAGDGIGGGLFTDSYNFQTQVTRSTFDANVAQGGDADNRGQADRVKGGHGLGGGLALGTNYGYGGYGDYGLSGGEGGDYQLILANCTFAYNVAEGGDADDATKKSRGGDGAGGGLFLQGGSRARLVNNTIAYNEARGGEGDDCDGEGRGGGLYSGDECEGCCKGECSQIDILNTLIALNLADSGNDVYGRVNSLGCNLIGDDEGSCGFDDSDPVFGDLLNVFDPKIGQLANNGGPTKTIALLKGSPAINRGNNIVLATSPGSIDKLTVDQRGNMRKAGPRVDIGAFEYGSPVLGRGQP